MWIVSEDVRVERREERRKTTELRSLPQCEETPPGGHGYWPTSTVGNRPSSWMAAIKAPSHDDMCTDSRGVD